MGELTNARYIQSHYFSFKANIVFERLYEKKVLVDIFAMQGNAGAFLTVFCTIILQNRDNYSNI